MSATARIKERAQELGFDLVGIAPAVTPEGVTHLRDWLERGYAGEMRYMERHARAREHPRHVLDGVRSVIVVGLCYGTVEPGPAIGLAGRVSRYAWGDDYHECMRGKLGQLAQMIRQEFPGCRTRGVVDTAPLMERDFARLAGIGWIGKNTMLINKRLGSWLFLGALLVDVALDTDAEAVRFANPLLPYTRSEFAEPLIVGVRVIGALDVQSTSPGAFGPAETETLQGMANQVAIAFENARLFQAHQRELAELGLVDDLDVPGVFIKTPVFPFVRFPGVDTILGPEMKSTGEVMGLDADLGLAFLKGQLNLAGGLPDKGQIFISVRNRDKRASVFLAKHLVELGFTLCATSGTAKALAASGIPVKPVKKVSEGRPHIVDQITDMKVDFVINTVHGAQSQKDSYSIRRTTLMKGIPYFTTISAAKAAVRGIAAIRKNHLQVKSIQEYHTS